MDPDFGTGSLKITPAHDVNDYTLGKSHSLDSINILNKDGTMNSVCGPKYDGMDRFECRERLWEDMEREGVALRREAVDNMRVPRSQRGGEVIEPMISTQWFVKTEVLLLFPSNSKHVNISFLFLIGHATQSHECCDQRRDFHFTK